MLRLFWQELKFRRNAILGWSLGLCFFPLVYIGIYPSVASEMAGLADLEIYKALGMSLGTFQDWVGSILIVFMPLVASIYAVINGTGTLAGEEEDGRLEMIVTLPLPRWQIVTAKAVALMISAVIMFLVVATVSVFVFQSIESQIETDMAAMDLFLPAGLCGRDDRHVPGGVRTQPPRRRDDCGSHSDGQLFWQQPCGVHPCS
ncbi:MAG TPA: ABC transporter permease subunit [Anaerolineales bacterium]|nr:ABC transporter permease subunit [Anaerolineales bacterium]